MKDFAIEVQNISKKYLLKHEKPTLVENILKRKTEEEFWALRDIDLKVKKGEKLGIIGPNGAGKTTLLKILAGITAPTEGAVKTQGNLVSLIELEAGFHPDLTGEENIMLNGLLVGMTKNEILRKMEDMIEFADIGHFIDAPFYTYSSGMALRLGFSVAVHADPDILVLDENLAVGDENFRNKSQKKIAQFFQQNKTIILVSHWLDFIKKNCLKAILMKRGRIVKRGNASEVIKFYQNPI